MLPRGGHGTLTDAACGRLIGPARSASIRPRSLLWRHSSCVRSWPAPPPSWSCRAGELACPRHGSDPSPTITCTNSTAMCSTEWTNATPPGHDGRVACRRRDRRRPRPAGDRPPRAGAGAPAAAGRAPVHRRASGVRGRARRAGPPPRRRASAPRRRSRRRSRCATATGTTSRCSAAATAPPGVRLSRPRRRARGRARRRGRDLAHPLQGHGRRGGDAAVSRPRWLEPLPDAAADARDRRVGDRRRKQIPSLELMERAGEGLARVVAEHVPAGPDRGRLRQGQQRRRRARRRAAAAPGRARRRRAAASGRRSG